MQNNYEKHAPRVSQVIAAVAKVSCKHGLWLVARVKKARQIKRLPVVSSTLLKSLVSNIRLFFILAHFSEESIPNILRVTYEHQYTLLFSFFCYLPDSTEFSTKSIIQGGISVHGKKHIIYRRKNHAAVTSVCSSCIAGTLSTGYVRCSRFAYCW